MTTIAYVACADSHEIALFRLDPERGALEPLTRVDTGGKVMPLAVSADRRRLHASIRSTPFEAMSFAIDPDDGGLSLLGRSPLPASMCWLGLDRSDRFLLGASYDAHCLSVGSVGADGTAGPVVQTEKSDPNAHSIQTDPGNRFAFAACLGGDTVLGYRFDASTGRIARLDTPAWQGRPGAGPRHFAFHPRAPFVCLLNELDATVEAFAYDAASGAWSHRQTIAALPDGFAGKPWAAEIRFTPDGRFVVASERRASILVSFAVDADSGRLTLVDRVSTETEPRGFAIDPSGRWIVAAGQASDRVCIHAIDPVTGALGEPLGQDTGRNPNWVEIVTLP